MFSRLPAVSCALLAFTLAIFAPLPRAQETAPADNGQERSVVESGVMGGLLIKRVQPVYPPLARQARIQGTVILHAIISRSGDIVKLQLVSGHPMLAPAAIEAVKQWKYRSFMVNGEAVEVETDIQVNFALAGESAGVVGDSPGRINPTMPATCQPQINGSDDSKIPCVRVSENVMRAMRIQKVDPEYPPLALQTHIEGTVILNVTVDTNGDIGDVALISGHPTLSPAAIEAVRQWRYTPYLLNGSPVNVQTMVHLTFAIPAGSESQGSVIDAPLPQRIRVSSGVSQGLLISRVQPEYPPDARQARIQGQVVLKVEIDKDGNVAQIELVSGHPLLVDAAIEAVKQWKYKPYLLNGDPVIVETQVLVNFTLAGG